MKKLVFSFLMILLILSIYIANILFQTGFFREVKTSFSGKIYDKIKLPGVEDIAISPDQKFLIFSSDNRKARLNQTERTGGLYLLNLESELLSPQLLTANFPQPFFPHGISLIQNDSNSYTLFVINHAIGNTVEIFSLANNQLVHEKSLAHELMISPNDIVGINENEFYFTNDHQNLEGFDRLKEDYLGLNASGVIHYTDGRFSQVASGIGYANGINYDKKRELLFVAASREFKLYVYQRNGDGTIDLVETIKTKTGVDNIEFDSEGKLWIGCHPNLMKFARYAVGKTDKSPSEIIMLEYRNKADYNLKSIFTDDGSLISASSVAVPYHDHVFIGNVMDENIIIWHRN